MERYNNLQLAERKRNNINETSSNCNNIFFPTNKCGGIRLKFLLRLKEVEMSIPKNSRKPYIPLNRIYSRLCKSFSVSKKVVKNELILLRLEGYIRFVRYRGIVLLDKLNWEEVIKDDKPTQ